MSLEPRGPTHNASRHRVSDVMEMSDVSVVAGEASLLSTPARLPELPPPRLGLLFVAVVHSVRDIRFVAASERGETLTERVAEYVRARAAVALWTHDAQSVQRLLDAGRRLEAIERYFDAVGERWDPEWLTTTSVEDA